MSCDYHNVIISKKPLTRVFQTYVTQYGLALDDVRDCGDGYIWTSGILSQTPVEVKLGGETYYVWDVRTSRLGLVGLIEDHKRIFNDDGESIKHYVNMISFLMGEGIVEWNDVLRFGYLIHFKDISIEDFINGWKWYDESVFDDEFYYKKGDASKDTYDLFREQFHASDDELDKLFEVISV